MASNAQPVAVKPRVKDAKAFEKLIRREVLDPLFVNLRAGLAEAQSVAEVYHVIDAGAFVGAGEGIPRAEVSKALNRIEKYHRDKLIKTFRTALGVDISQLLTSPEIAAFMKGKISDNVNLISTLKPNSLAGLKERIAKEFAEAPFDEKRLTEILRKQYKSSGYNLRRIARDQTSKMVGNLTQIRHRQLGIQGYRWSTAGDSRVRPSHNDNNNLFFRWDSPPATGHPGEEIQCRCIAIPAVTRADRKRLQDQAPGKKPTIEPSLTPTQPKGITPPPPAPKPVAPKPKPKPPTPPPKAKPRVKKDVSAQAKQAAPLKKKSWPTDPPNADKIEAHYKEWEENLTGWEEARIRYYTGNGYQPINEVLRDKNFVPEFAPLRVAKDDIKTISNALRYAPKATTGQQ